MISLRLWPPFSGGGLSRLTVSSAKKSKNSFIHNDDEDESYVRTMGKSRRRSREGCCSRLA